MSEDQALPKKRTGLGRGLSSLLGEIQADTAVAVSGRADAGVPLPDGVRLVPASSRCPISRAAILMRMRWMNWRAP